MDSKTTVTLDTRMVAAGLAPVDAADLAHIGGGFAMQVWMAMQAARQQAINDAKNHPQLDAMKQAVQHFINNT